MRTICFVSGTRADYGLLRPLIDEVARDPELRVQIVATGAHLSPEFGLTWRDIAKDGFDISERVEILLSADSDVAVCKAMGLAMLQFPDAYRRLKPDVVVALGDRFELFAAVAAALVCRVPVAHLHGGELTEGAFDDAFRHGITKMSQLHFVACEPYRQRVIQLGEQPDTVFTVGALGIDNIKKMSLLSREDLERSIGFELGGRNLIVTYHPVTREGEVARDQFGQLLSALDARPDTHLIFTGSNADPEGRSINEMIHRFAAERRGRVASFASMGQLRYLSTLQYVDGVVGNSSSGIIEAPSFQIGTVNIGDRQRGRIKPASVIDCAPDAEGIGRAIQTLYSPTFRASLQDLVNPYGDGNAAPRIKEILKRHDFGECKKTFHDL